MKTLAVIWVILSMAIPTTLLAPPYFALDERPWPGYINAILGAGWFWVSLALFLGITPERVIRFLKEFKKP